MGGSDEKILFPDEVVEGFTVRPLTLAQAVELAPTLGAMVAIVEESSVGAAFSTILDSIDIESEAMAAVTAAFMKVWKDVVKALPRLVPKILPLAPKIISVSLRISMEEAVALDLGKSIRLLGAIAACNAGYLKNYFGPGSARQSMAS